jgi:predicted nuclease of restriction endonuclease-like RecB superfamily
VAVEIVSYWRAGYLRRRIEMLDSIDRPFVLVVSERLQADREKLEVELPGQVVFYKGVILPKKVIAAAEAALSSETSG